MIFPGKTYSVNMFHRARLSLVRVLSHLGDNAVDPEHIALPLRYKRFAARAEAELYSMAES